MMSDPQRSDPFAGNLDLSDFKPAAPKRPKIEPAAIREVSEANNFPSRAALLRNQRRPRPGQGRNVAAGRDAMFNSTSKPRPM